MFGQVTCVQWLVQALAVLRGGGMSRSLRGGGTSCNLGGGSTCGTHRRSQLSADLL